MSPGFTLVLETSTPHASLARVEEDARIERRDFRSDRNHNAMLFEPLKELLGDRKASEIRLVLVGSGPGSYSGTRVGIAAAQGTAIAADCQAVAIPSILAVPSAAGGAACLAIGDARRDSYWTAMLERYTLLGDPELCDAAGLKNRVASALAHGIPVFSFEETNRFPLPGELLEQVVVEIPDAALLWAAWCAASVGARDSWAAAIPQPMYLKPPHITPGKNSCLVREPG
jgi:tRNA threonylcarbamoyl adenosine modification protein YeaZ